MQNLSRVEQTLYSTSTIFLLIEVLGISINNLDVNLWLFSASGEIQKPEMLSVALLFVSFISFAILFIARFPELASSFFKIISEDSTLLSRATQHVREKTGKDHAVNRVAISSLFNPSANLGIWMTSKGTWSAPIVFAISPITYFWLAGVSVLKSFFTRGGFFRHLFPAIFGVSPLVLYWVKYGANAI